MPHMSSLASSSGLSRAPSRAGVRRLTLGCLVGALTLGLLALPGAGHAAAAGGCITRLPVTVTLPSAYAAGYGATVPLRVATTGPAIRDLHAGIYTFGGDQIAAGVRRPVLTAAATVKLKLAFGALQEGKYTLVVTGSPNADPSCGPKKLTRVISFRGCLTSLPLKFVDPPGGIASDYGGFLSVALQSTGPLIRNLEGSVYDANGTLFGTGTLGALYGKTTLDMALKQPLVPGDFTVIIDGLIDQPKSCGPKTAQIGLHFN
jgi:hypothetical protein